MKFLVLLYFMFQYSFVGYVSFNIYVSNIKPKDYAINKNMVRSRIVTHALWVGRVS